MDRVSGVRRIVWPGPVPADVRRLHKPRAMRILSASHRFAESGSGDVKALRKERQELRVRIGDYQVVYEIDDTKQTATVPYIGHRRDVYRQSPANNNDCAGGGGFVASAVVGFRLDGANQSWRVKWG